MPELRLNVRLSLFKNGDYRQAIEDVQALP
jgi:hypothetical protein